MTYQRKTATVFFSCYFSRVCDMLSDTLSITCVRGGRVDRRYSDTTDADELAYNDGGSQLADEIRGMRCCNS